MRKEDLVKILMVYHNDYSNEFRKKLNKKKKAELEDEFNKMDEEKFINNLIINEEVLKVYQDLVFRGYLTEENEKYYNSSIPQFLFIKKGYTGNYEIDFDIEYYLKDKIPPPETYYLIKIKCNNTYSNYAIKDHLEIIKSLDIKLSTTNKVKKNDIKKFKQLTNIDLRDEEVEWLLFVAVKYFEKYKKIDLKKFYKFFFHEMKLEDEYALFKKVMPFIKGNRFDYWRYEKIHPQIDMVLKIVKHCTKISNIRDFMIFRDILIYFFHWDFSDIYFDEDSLKEEKIVKQQGLFLSIEEPFDKYEEYTFAFLKGYIDLLKVLGLFEVEYKNEESLKVDIFYDNIYAAKLSNIGLWYYGYTNFLKLPSTKKSTIKAFNKILAIMFDENDLILKVKLEKFFTKKGNFYFLDDEKILKNITSKKELKERIKEIEDLKLPKNFKNHLNTLLKKFKEIKKVDFTVLEVNEESLKALKEIKDLFLIAQDNKIIVKDIKKFKKEAEKLGVFIKE